jgi:signal peptidase
MFRLRGDANPTPDPVLVTQDQLLGRIVVTLPMLGFLLAMMSMPIGVLSLLSVGATLLAAAWVVEELDDAKDDDERPAHGYPRRVTRPSR